MGPYLFKFLREMHMSLFEKLVEAGKRQFRFRTWKDGSTQGSIELVAEMQTDEKLSALVNPHDANSFIAWARKNALQGEPYIRVWEKVDLETGIIAPPRYFLQINQH